MLGNGNKYAKTAQRQSSKCVTRRDRFASRRAFCRLPRFQAQ
jgi:hypothetical protein